MFWNSDNKKKKESFFKSNKKNNDFYTSQYDDVRTAIVNGSCIEGRLSFNSPIKIDGQLKGALNSTDEVVVGPDAIVDGDITAKSVIIFGKVNGKVNVSERTALLKGAMVTANIDCKAFNLADGAYYDGQCVMNEQRSVADQLPAYA